MSFLSIDGYEPFLQRLRETFPDKSDEWLYAWLLSAQSYLATGVGRPELLEDLN